MKTLAELRKERAEVVDKMDALTKAEDFDRDEFDKLKTRADELDTDIARLEDVEARKAHFAERAPNQEDPPKIEFKDGPADRGFQSFDEHLGAIIQASADGGHVDERLRRAAGDKDVKELRGPTGMSTLIGADGGFFLEDETSTKLLDPMFETGILVPRVQQHTITNPAVNSVKFLVLDETDRGTGTRLGGLRLYTRAQAATIDDSKTAFREWEVTTHSVMGLCYFTQEQLDDIPGMVQRITNYFHNEAGYEIDDWILNGDGASEPKGITGHDAVISHSGETSQPADTLVTENFTGMYARMRARNRANAIWTYPADALPELMNLTLDIGTGGVPLWIPGNTLVNQPNDAILGRPMLEMEQSPTIGDANDVMFIDPTQYLLVRKGGVRTDLSIHVKFIYGEVILRFMFRIGGDSWWKSAITPANDGDTLGPFVGLASR
jgi:HK97 family phage major capsid protein